MLVVCNFYYRCFIIINELSTTWLIRSSAPVRKSTASWTWDKWKKSKTKQKPKTTTKKSPNISLHKGYSKKVCISALEARADTLTKLQWDVTKALVRRRMEDKHLRARRAQSVPGAVRKWKLFTEGDEKKRIRVAAG